MRRLPSNRLRRVTLLAAAAVLTSAGVAAAACDVSGLQSVGSNQQRDLLVVNDGDAAVLSLFWVNFEGRMERYAVIEPGGSHGVSTFTGHAWAVETASGACAMTFTVQDSVEIRLR